MITTALGADVASLAGTAAEGPRPRRPLAVILKPITALRFLLGTLLAVAGTATAQSPGYVIAGNQIRVETPAHWHAWDIAVGAATITPDGTVFPRFQRRHVNAALEAYDYDEGKLAGGAAAGSNDIDARHVIDGDPTTYWGPDVDASQEDWWIQVRLGRVVVVDSVVLHFVDESLGEPFLQFEVTGWRRPGPLSPSDNFLVGTRISAFWALYRTDRPNKTVRRISFVPRTTESASPDFVGDPLEVIHIRLTDSEGDRFRDVLVEAYERLPSEARGAVEYYRRSATGRQTLTSKEAYEQLDPERRGRIRYFQRERPRLAEVEVWTKGDNFNHGLVSRGAHNTFETPRSPQGPVNVSTSVTDGDPSTGPTGTLWSNDSATYIEDLGTRFWVDALDFMTDGGSTRQFSVDVSDGSLAPDGSIRWDRIASELINTRYRTFAVKPTRVRYLRTRFRSSSIRIALTEVMLYGEGYVAEAVLTSKMIDLGGRKGLVSIEWDAETPEGTRLEITTRTGDTLSEVYIYHDNDGNVVTEDRYTRQLPRVKKGEITTGFGVSADFSVWSLPYDNSGDEIRSPRTRRYLQLQARVVADTASKFGPPARLHAIRVNTADLYTDKLTGEIWPTRVERIGAPEPRSFYLRPDFGNQLQGFDEIRIAATAATLLDLVDVRVGTRADFRNGEQRLIEAAEIERTATAPDTMAVRLPEIVHQGVELIEVRLQSTVHANSAAFEAAVRDGAYDGAWQIANVGDATERVNSQTNVVLALADNRVLSDLRVEPPLFTPNGDGVNDVATFQFSVNRVHQTYGGVAVSVYDLSGRLVRRLHLPEGDPRGPHAVVWDGDDSGGRPVPPGAYVVRLDLQTMSDRARGTLRTRTVHVAY